MIHTFVFGTPVRTSDHDLGKLERIIVNNGIANQIEPPERFVGDVYAGAELPHVPRTLRDAIEAFTASAFAKGAFGEDVVEHYAHFFTQEQAAYDSAVTDWERRRYFERI